MVMGATPSHVRTNLGRARVLLRAPLSLCVGLFLGPPSSSDISSRLLQLIQFCLFISFNFFLSCCFTSAQCCGPYKLVESGLTTHCPCQLKTRPVSSRQIHMSIVYTLLFTSSLTTVPSRVFRMCGIFSSSTTMFPARTTSCIEMRNLTTFALLNVIHL